jgi:gliding motility-associated-like protein
VGTHSVNIRDANNCLEVITATITGPTALLLDKTFTDPLCYGQSNGTITIQATGGTPAYLYDWGSGLAPENTATDLAAGTYTITCNDANGCSATIPIILTDPAPAVVGLIAEDTELNFGQTTQLTATPSGNIAGSPSYNWEPLDQLSCTSCFDPVAGPLSQNMTYTVTMVDDNGCEASAKVDITVDENTRILAVPNAFTPNNDLVNDTFNVYGYGFVIFNLKVFNRWGEKVFESNSQNIGWNGYYKGELQLPGVYVYVVDVTYIDGVNEIKKGSVTLIR